MSAPAEDEAVAARSSRADRLAAAPAPAPPPEEAAARRRKTNQARHAEAKAAREQQLLTAVRPAQDQGLNAAGARQVRGLEGAAAEEAAAQQRQEPEPEPEEPQQAAKWWESLEIEELRQDLKHSQPAPAGWDDIDDSWMRPKGV